MLEISIQHLQYRYTTQSENLLTNVNFIINKHSRIGQLGPNGCGKSTLLALLRGKQLPSAGKITSNVSKIAYLPQTLVFVAGQTVADYLWQTHPQLNELRLVLERFTKNPVVANAAVYDDFFVAGGYELMAKINAILPVFAFTEADLSKSINELSGGEQTKLALCALLLTEPELLLLDEPTNHLDSASLQWLEHYLRQLTIPYVLISHDRSILNSSVTQIIELNNGESSIYNGNYEFYQQQKALYYQQDLLAHQKHKKKVRQLHEAVVQRQQWSKVKQKPTRSVTKTGRICKRDDGSLPVSKGRMTHSAKAVKNRMQQAIEREEINKPYLQKKRQL